MNECKIPRRVPVQSNNSINVGSVAIGIKARLYF